MKKIVVRDKIIEEVIFEEKGNDSDVIGEKINLVANEKIIEVKENVEKDANDIVKEIEEVIDEEKGEVDVVKVVVMLKSENVKDMNDLLVDSLPLNNKKQDTYTKLSDLTQKFKGVNDNNTLVSLSNDNDLTSFIKASVGISSRTVHIFSHETNLSKKMGSRINKKLEVKFEIRCGTYFSNYKALSENEHHFRKVNNIKDYVIKIIPAYVHNCQHMFHNDKEMIDNSVLDDDHFF